jgi:uncharacterized protein (TIGR00730 family)
VTTPGQRLRRVCVFCGSSPGADAAYVAAAERAGAELARRRIDLVYGGGNVGLMGVLADAVLRAGGHVIGVIPEALMARDVGHRGLPDLRVVKTMHERKALMAELADAFVALPGGLGTFDELFEVLTWAQLGFHNKPCALLNVRGFFDPLLRLLDHAVEERFLRDTHRSLLAVGDDFGSLLDRLPTRHLRHERKWIDRDTL